MNSKMCPHFYEIIADVQQRDASHGYSGASVKAAAVAEASIWPECSSCRRDCWIQKVILRLSDISLLYFM